MIYTPYTEVLKLRSFWSISHINSKCTLLNELPRMDQRGIALVPVFAHPQWTRRRCLDARSIRGNLRRTPSIRGGTAGIIL